MTTLDKTRAFSLLNEVVALFEKDEDPDLSDEFLDEIAPIFGEELFPVFAEFCDRIETSRQKVMALTDLFDCYAFDGEYDFLQGEVEPIYEALSDSLIELFDHLHKNTKDLEDAPVYIQLLNHGANSDGLRDCTMSVYFSSPVGSVLWDRQEFALRHPIVTFQCLTSQVDVAEYDFLPKLSEAPEPALYRYHPERFRAYHQFSDWLRRYFDMQVDKKSGYPTIDQLNKIAQHIMEETNLKGLRDIPLRPRISSSARAMDIVNSTISVSMTWGTYVQSGRQIFDFPPSMVSMFRKTDVDDIPLNMVRMPYRCQYLYFGPQSDLELEPGWFIDGAYVQAFEEDGDFAVMVTTCPSDHSLSRLWPGYPEPYYFQSFIEKYRLTNLGTAVDEVLAEDIATHKKSIEEAPYAKNISEELAAEAREAGDEIPDGLDVVDVSGVNSRVRLDATTRRFPIYRSALRLVVNALCYITAYAEDVQESWPDGTPERLKAQTASSKFKEARNAKSKLESLGYVPVNFCGRSWQHHSEVVVGKSRKGVAIHWRRGHWKRQPYGEGRKLRKLIWIMPTMVGANDSNDEPLGHIYLAS